MNLEIIDQPLAAILTITFSAGITVNNGVSLDIENYCTLRLFFVPLSYVKLDHFDRQL